MRLILERPLLAFDLETTGLNIERDRIVEISCVKIHVDGPREIRTRRLNPTIPISPSATRIHGIRDEDVAHESTFAQVAKSLHLLLADCDLTGFNIEHYDLPMLVKEFERAGIKYPEGPVRIIDSCTIYHAREPRTLQAAYRHYCGKELTQAHQAQADTEAAAEILLAQLERYPDLPGDIAALHDVCHPTQPDWLDPEGKLIWADGEVMLTFGRYRQVALKHVCVEDPEYLKWVVRGNFSSEVVGIVRDALAGVFPMRP